MYVDLLTLYLLATGTLLASAAMMFWEQRSNPTRGRPLRILAAGFATLALGCAAALMRHSLPGVLGSALCNLIMLSGYLLVLGGVASLRGRQYRVASLAVLAVMAVVWAVSGTRWQAVVWFHVSALPIGLISAMTAWEMYKCDAMKPLHARHIIVAITSVHALFYVARTFALPWLVAHYGPTLQSMASKITVYEGVLYSVVLPMALLKLIREETHRHLLWEAQTDYLTRLGNRRWFFEHGARVVDSRGGQGPLAVLAFDLDHFKAINDVYGHAIGDRVLKAFSDIARSVMGEDAVFARIGGEEFAALLHADKARNAKDIGEAVARRFAEAIAQHVDGMDVSATVSIGMALYQDRVPMLADGLAAADRALYRAKALGGNRLEFTEESVSITA